MENVLEETCARVKGETTDLDHSKLKINHVNSTESLEIVVDHLNSLRITRTHSESLELTQSH